MTEFEGLDSAETKMVIELLAAFGTPDEIKKRLFDLSGKAISTKSIQAIAMRFRKEIRERNEAYVQNVEGSPLAHKRVRLDILKRVLDASLQSKPAYNIKQVNALTNEEQLICVEKQELANAISALTLAKNEMNESEKIEIMRMKELGKVEKDDDDDEWEVKTGVSSA